MVCSSHFGKQFMDGTNAAACVEMYQPSVEMYTSTPSWPPTQADKRPAAATARLGGKRGEHMQRHHVTSSP